MPFHKTFGIDLGTSTVKIYSQEQDTMITEKNMIAIRNQNQVLAVGNEAYGMYEKNPSNVSVISPMAFGKIADVTHTEMVLQLCWKRAAPEENSAIRCIWQFLLICQKLNREPIIPLEIPTGKTKFIW